MYRNDMGLPIDGFNVPNGEVVEVGPNYRVEKYSFWSTDQHSRPALIEGYLFRSLGEVPQNNREIVIGTPGLGTLTQGMHKAGRMLASLGRDVFLYNSTGFGFSQGEPNSIITSAQSANMHDAVFEMIKQGYIDIGLLGFSYSGGMVSQTASILNTSSVILEEICKKHGIASFGPNSPKIKQIFPGVPHTDPFSSLA